MSGRRSAAAEPAPAAGEYMTLTAKDRANIARDQLRGREADHYRLTLIDPADNPAVTAQIEALQTHITWLQARVLEAEEAVPVPAPNPSQPPPVIP